MKNKVDYKLVNILLVVLIVCLLFELFSLSPLNEFRTFDLAKSISLLVIALFAIKSLLF